MTMTPRPRGYGSSRIILLLSALFFLGIIEVFISTMLVYYYYDNSAHDGDGLANIIIHANATTVNANANEEVRMQTVLAQLYFGDEATSDNSNGRMSSSIPDGSYHFPAKSNKNFVASHPYENATKTNTTTTNFYNSPAPPLFNDFHNFRPVLFLTTHMSDSHIWHLDACWPPAMHNSKLLSRADVMVYFTSAPEEDDRRRPMNKLRHRFRHQNLTIHVRDNPGYEEGAMASMKEAMGKHWFDEYDWVIRLNPDVFIRNETFLLDTMENDVNASGILIDCDAKNPLKFIHTDFFAIKPSVLSKGAFMNVSMDVSVEGHFSLDIRESIVNRGNARWVPGSQPTWHTCRAGFGRKMEEADVFHYHLGKDLSRPWAKMQEPNEMNMDCPIPFSR